MKIISVELPPELEARLLELTRKTGKSEQRFVMEALEEYIADFEDSVLAKDTLEKVLAGEATVRPFEDWEKEFDRRKMAD